MSQNENGDDNRSESDQSKELNKKPIHKAEEVKDAHNATDDTDSQSTDDDDSSSQLLEESDDQQPPPQPQPEEEEEEKVKGNDEGAARVSDTNALQTNRETLMSMGYPIKIIDQVLSRQSPQTDLKQLIEEIQQKANQQQQEEEEEETPPPHMIKLQESQHVHVEGIDDSDDNDNDNDNNVKQVDKEEVKEVVEDDNKSKPQNNNPYIDQYLMQNLSHQFSPKQNEQFVASHNINNNNNEDSDESSSEPIGDANEQINEIKVQVDEDEDNNNNTDSSNDDDDDVVNGLNPRHKMKAIQSCIFEGVKNKIDIVEIQSYMAQYDALYKEANEDGDDDDDYDWNDFVYNTQANGNGAAIDDDDDEDDEISLLQYAFNECNYAIIPFLLSEKKISPLFGPRHCIYKVLDDIITQIKNNVSDEELETKYKQLLICTLLTLRPPVDGQYKKSYKILLTLIEYAFEYKSRFLCKNIEQLLEQTINDDSNQGFVDNLDETKFDGILETIEENSKHYKREDGKRFKADIFEIIFDRIIKRKNHISWMMSCKYWEKWIFKDWEIFSVILSKTDDLVREYCKYNADVCDARALIFKIMHCMGNNGAANTNGSVLICNYIADCKDNYAGYESFNNYQFLNGIIMDIIREASFNRKARKEYIWILFYHFMDVKKALSFEEGIIAEILKQSNEKDVNNNKELQNAFPKSLFAIFVASMIRFAGNDHDNDYEHKQDAQNAQSYFAFREKEKGVNKWLKNMKIGGMPLSKAIDKTIMRCLTVCHDAKGGNIPNIHSNVLIKFALTLSVFVNKIDKNGNCASNITGQEILSQLFCDNFDENASNQIENFSIHQLRTFVYKILKPCFDSRIISNVHVLFISIDEPANDDDDDDEDDEKAANTDLRHNKIANINLINLSIVNGMTPKQIAEFLTNNLNVRDDANTAKYSDMTYKLLNNKATKWNEIDFNDAKCLRNKNGKAVVLLITPNGCDEQMDVSLNTLLGHIHRYSLMSVKEKDEIYYYDMDKSVWLRGNVAVQGVPKKNGNIQHLHLYPKDPKDVIFSGDEDRDKYFFDVFTADLRHIIPSSVQHWFPVSYFERSGKRNGSELHADKWQKPYFTFIYSFILSTNNPLFHGHIKHNNEKLHYGATEFISGFTPYPPNLQLPPNIDITQTLSLKHFGEQHFHQINDEYKYDEDTDNKHVWLKLSTWDKNKKQMHDFLVSHLENVQIIRYKKQCTMYLLTAQHLQKISETHKINMDFIRAGRDCSMQSDCFILIEFRGFAYWSSVINYRFGSVYLKDLNNSQPELIYSLPNYGQNGMPINEKQKKNKNKNKKKSFSYSKQRNKQKRKHDKDGLIKDWVLAEDIIKEWMKKNLHCIPKDTEAWEAVIKNDIMRHLYPNFQGPQDIEQLACRAVGIDCSEFIVEKKNQPSQKQHKRQRPEKQQKQQKQPKLPKKQPKPRQQAKNNNNNQNDKPVQAQQVQQEEASNANSQKAKPLRVDMDDSRSDVRSVQSSVHNGLNYEIDNVFITNIHTCDEQITDSISHGSIIGSPNNDVSNEHELIELFKAVNNACLDNMGIRITKAFFLFVANWQILQTYDSNVNENTLFLYVRFESHNDNAAFHLLDKQSLGFKVIVAVRKPKIKKAIQSCKPYRHKFSKEQQTNPQRNDTIHQNLPIFHGSSNKLNFSHCHELFAKKNKKNNNYQQHQLVQDIFNHKLYTRIPAMPPIKVSNKNNNMNNNMDNMNNDNMSGRGPFNNNNNNNNSDLNNARNGYKNNNNNNNNNQYKKMQNEGNNRSSVQNGQNAENEPNMAIDEKNNDNDSGLCDRMDALNGEQNKLIQQMRAKIARLVEENKALKQKLLKQKR